MSMLTSTMLMVAAAQASAEPPYPNCADPVTQSDMRFCAARDYEAADANSAGTPGKGYFAVLLDAQRA